MEIVIAILMYLGSCGSSCADSQSTGADRGNGQGIIVVDMEEAS